MPLPCTLRPARLEDLAALLPLSQEAFGKTAWSEGLFRQVLQNAAPSASQRVTVAELPGGGLAGYMVVLEIVDLAEMQALAVGSGWRRRGIGSALLAESVAFCRRRGLAHIYLEVRAGNEAAQAFYRRHGFRESGLRRAYYEHPVEDAVLMRLEVGAAPPAGG